MKDHLAINVSCLGFSIALITSTAFAQSDPPQQPATQGPMVVERVHNGFAGAPDFKVTTLDRSTGRLVGGYGGWLIDNTLLIGAGGYWLTN